MKKCAECQQDFEFKTHNQKYCSNQCCRIATNKRIMQKYYQKRERLAGKERLCLDCNARLSKHNPLDICALCEKRRTKSKTGKTIKDIENVISNLEKSKSKKSSRN